MEKDKFASLVHMVILAVVALLAVVVVVSLNLKEAFRANDCLINRLRIEEAKYQWALQNGKKIGDEVPEKEIIAALGDRLDCPSGGKYSYGAVGSETTCSIHKKRGLARPR